MSIEINSDGSFELGGFLGLDDLAFAVRAINEQNGWSPVTIDEWSDKHKIPAILALIHSEVSEAIEAFRKDDGENFIEELADVLIRVLDCAGGLTNDFDAVVLSKLRKNSQRGLRHGGKRI